VGAATTHHTLSQRLKCSENSISGSDAVLTKLDEWVIRNSRWIAIVIIAAAFAVRFYYAAACYLNPDEAQHFNAARPESWLGAYHASRALAHPPLFILVLHAILLLGRTELILRLPSLVFGAAALWITFVWVRRILGDLPALAGLLFMALSPMTVSAATEVRQYSLLLFFICSALYATERALDEGSIKWAIGQAIFLLGALLTHYTALVAIVSLDLYVLIRMYTDGVSRRILFTIGASQIVLGAVLAWLYFGHIRQAPVLKSSNVNYLSWAYFNPARETLLGFSWRALTGTFSHMTSYRLGLVSILVFAAGLAALVIGRTKSRRLMALLIISPLAVGLAAGICHVFPFAGSRHQTYLLPFVAAGLSAALTWMKRTWAAPLVLLGMLLGPLWVAHIPPDNNTRSEPVSDMRAAIHYINHTIPHDAPLFVDQETNFLLKYYLGRDDSSLNSFPASLGHGKTMGGHQVIEPAGSGWSFNSSKVFQQVNACARSLNVARGSSLWIVSVAWRGPALATQISGGAHSLVEKFGETSIIEILRN
jgi:Dolichyl-phosphate-mannose-protein mannosyltransferase